MFLSNHDNIASNESPTTFTFHDNCAYMAKGFVKLKK